MSCVVYNCPSLTLCSDESLQYFPFPKESPLKEQWLDVLSLPKADPDGNF